MDDRAAIECISAITLCTADMPRAIAFYCALGFVLSYGADDAPFVSLRAGGSYVNLAQRPPPTQFWGRVIFHVADVDAIYARAVTAGYTPQMAPADAPWGERFFHLFDPDGNELSFAQVLAA